MKFVVALVLAAGCGHSAPPSEAPTGRAPGRPAPAGFEKADLVSFGNGTLATYAIERDRVTKLGEIQIAEPLPPQSRDYDPDAPYQFQLIGGWADREHLFVRTGNRKVVMVTREGVFDVTLPDKKTLDVPHSDDASETDDYGRGKDFVNVDLVVEDGSAWWSRCPFSFANDGGLCEQWVNVRLWPSPKVEISQGQRNARTFAWRVDPPRGYTLTPPEQPTTCAPPSGAPVALPRTPGEDPDQTMFLAQWVSASPPRLLVMYGISPEFSLPYVTATLLFDGCNPEPVFRGGDATPGPDGLWESSGHVFRGGQDLGAAGDVRFRPAR